MFGAPQLPTSSQDALKIVVRNLPFVLPCKYCRASLTDYYGADPPPMLASAPAGASAAAWMYRIHNRVNGKLREQKLIEGADPAWAEVKARYKQWLGAPCSTRRMVGWDFLFSVAYTTPSPRVASAPMPGAPPRDTLAHDDTLLNRWNMLSREARIPYIRDWWAALPAVLPFAEWRDAWTAAVKAHGHAPVTAGRKAVTAWLYKMEKSVCQTLAEQVPHNSFEGLCSELATFSSGCGTSKKSKTCRATKRTARDTLKKRRRTTYRATGGYL